MKNRILFIDAYDSFSNNIITLLKDELSVTVEVVKIDDARLVLNDDAFFTFLDGFDAVVAGPGPGHPTNTKDVGLLAKLWHLPAEHLIPVLGVCLGFQSLALAFGATVERLREPRHGIVTPVVHCNSDIFAVTGDVLATQYHSLHVQLGHDQGTEVWKPSRSCRELIPLAWDVDSLHGPVLMAAKHCHKPFWGVQYHPESICTNEEGSKIVGSWWREVRTWLRGRPGKPSLSASKPIHNGFADDDARKNTGRQEAMRGKLAIEMQWNMLHLPHHVKIVEIVNMLRSGCGGYEPIFLESGMRNGKPVNAETGHFSIIGLHDAQSTHVRYSVCSHKLEVVAGAAVMTSRSATISEVFSFLEEYVEEYRACDGPKDVPFWGGLVGFISYEAGLESIDFAQPIATRDRWDVWFVSVERSIVVDHVNGIAYVQTMRSGDEKWLYSMEDGLQQLKKFDCEESVGFEPLEKDAKVIYSPQMDEYCQKVRECQANLRAGSSYELCLTDATLLKSQADPWRLYLRLRHLNPAPFGAFMRLPPAALSGANTAPGVDVISSSPERFLSWSRHGQCQFRPIKGTVKKTSGMSRMKAEELLSSPKERAENLMIVDLIRHDLSGVEGVRDVRVPKLMVVEEYEAVFQLVSVIEGTLAGSASGIEVLAASLPPGSMTGAPKKRSCQLLQDIENQQPRGLYSGVIGYLDAGGGGDFSVVIRSAFRWSDEGDWRVGAGGAVTALSSPAAEYGEMLAKRESVLPAFVSVSKKKL